MYKAWAAIVMLMIIWKSDLSDKIKWEFFQAISRVVTNVWLHYMDLNKMFGEKSRWKLHEEYCMLFLTNPWSTTLQNSC